MIIIKNLLTILIIGFFIGYTFTKKENTKNFDFIMDNNRNFNINII